MPKLLFSFILTSIFLLPSPGEGHFLKKRKLKVVPNVDINRYLGTWYEAARNPHRFEKDCVRVRAEYSLREDDLIEVINRCETADGEERDIEGVAWIPNPNVPAKLKVQFFWPFSGKYWIIELGEDYEYAVVSEPRRKNLWILSRELPLDDGLYDQIRERLIRKGFNLRQFRRIDKNE